MSFFIQSFIVLLGTRCLISSAMMIDGTPMTMDEAIVAAGSNSSKTYELMQDNATVLIELDMLYDMNTYMAMREEMDKTDKEDVQPEGARKKRNTIFRNDYRWANARVPYDIEPSCTTPSDTALIKAAIADYERYTCLRFPQYSNETDRIRFQNGSGCSSYVGKIGGLQGISLARGCRYKSIIIHMIGHAIGFNHEQTRPDRGSKVIIHNQNIRPNQAYNLMPHTPSQQDFGVPYDYSSIMHYSESVFSADGRITIEAREPQYQKEMGNGEGLSFNDIRLANAMYSCSAHCSSRIQCPVGAFLGKDCQCYCDSGIRSDPIKVCKTVGTTVTTETPTPSATDPCVDKSSSCDSWAQEGYCDEQNYREYMVANCPLACKCCPVTTKAPTAAVPIACINTQSNCDFLTQVGYCGEENFIRYMMTNCPLACKFCSVLTEPPAPFTPVPCVDRYASCDHWVQGGYCDETNHREFMMTNCPLACRFCFVTTEASTTAAPDICKNRQAYCDTWVQKGYCDVKHYKEYMATNCPLACNCCSVTTEAPTPANPIACVDRQSNCDYMVKEGCCVDEGYIRYMMTNCPLACGFCSFTTEAPTTAATVSCVDRQSNCDYWVQERYCDEKDFREYMMTNCPLACKWCSVTTEAPTIPAPVACINRQPRCDYWLQKGYCDEENYREYMVANCPLACKCCSEEMTTTSVVPTTSVPTGSCVDKFGVTCPSWAYVGYCETNTYVMDVCKKSCNLCTDTVTIGETNPDCEAWAKFGACDIPTYSDYMKTNCPISCNISTSNDEPVKDCMNERPAEYCRRKQNMGLCGWSLAFRRECRKTCNLC